MDVILLEKVENLGNIGDQVSVRSGYGRNFLLPKGKATLATPENIKKFEAIRAELEAKQAAELGVAKERAAALEALTISITAKCGPEGKLFGSLGTVDIAEAVTEAGVEIQRAEVRLPDGPIRESGDHEVELHLHSDVNVTLAINVIGEEDAVAAELAAEVAGEAPAADDAEAEADAEASEDSEEA